MELFILVKVFRGKMLYLSRYYLFLRFYRNDRNFCTICLDYSYLQLKYTVSMPEKFSICLNRGREESVGNDEVSIVCPRKYEM